MTRSGGVLRPGEAAATAAWIASVQLPSGMIPWYPGGHADPWNHVEAAMALLVGGRRVEAEAALRWLPSVQHADGSWCFYYLADGVEEPRRDPNVCAYVATGAWFHHLVTGDDGLLAELWPAVEAAVDFVLRLQQPGGEILWSLDADGVAGSYALMTGSASIVHSLRCAVAAAEHLGEERPDWELAAGRLAHAVAHRPQSFEPKDRWAMDWYYPVLCGAVTGDAGRARLLDSWPDFVVDGLGVRCVRDKRWVTAAETAECALAADAVGLADAARRLLGWTAHLRAEDGAYWTGCVHPECVRFPGGERSTYSAAAVLLVDHALGSDTAAAGLFRGASLPPVLALEEAEEAAGR
ncbi:MAG: prenyltransferase [Acidimicrobiales bacterium]